MDKDSSRPPDRYDRSGNIEDQYVDDAQLVFVNRRGITDLATQTDWPLLEYRTSPEKVKRYTEGGFQEELFDPRNRHC